MLRRYQRSQCKKAALQQQRKLHTQTEKQRRIFVFDTRQSREIVDFTQNGGNFQHFGPSTVDMGCLRSESKTHLCTIL